MWIAAACSVMRAAPDRAVPVEQIVTVRSVAIPYVSRHAAMTVWKTGVKLMMTVVGLFVMPVTMDAHAWKPPIVGRAFAWKISAKYQRVMTM